MTTEIAKIWWDDEKMEMVINPIPESEIYKPVPVAWFFPGSADEPMSVALDKDLDDAQKANCIPLYFGSSM